MMNRIRKIDSSITPAQVRASYGPASCGIEFDSNALVNSLVLNPDSSGRRQVLTSGGSQTFTPLSSFFAADSNATFGPTVGNNTVSWNGGFRQVVQGTGPFTKTKTAMSAIHGVYWLTGSNASTMPKAAVLGEVHAGVTARPDGAFVSLLGAGAVTRAMFAVGSLDNNVNGALYGLDLSTNSVQGTKAIGYSQADLNLSNDVAVIVGGSSAPTNAVTGAGWAGPGSLFIMTGGTIKLYMNTNTKASPTWTAQT